MANVVKVPKTTYTYNIEVSKEELDYLVAAVNRVHIKGENPFDDNDLFNALEEAGGDCDAYDLTDAPFGGRPSGIYLVKV